ncbi:hypothetical protein VTO42DRAFT_34 [Malbranchea cinnamomea]
MSCRLKQFQESMERVYGEFSTVSDPKQWVPPPTAGGHRGRYLWTDAFGVLNFLTLYREFSYSSPNQFDNEKYLHFAQRLVTTVHDILGRTRDGKSRLPRATDQEPLKGGLRIGKEEATGPDGDGQYHHYLTMWMFALNRLSLATGDPTYNRQAVSLAKAIHPHFFIDRTSARPHMVWKVSMDLSRPLVASEGNLDPIDGYVVFSLLQASSIKYGDGRPLDGEINDYKRVMARKGKQFVSTDTLDLGMTLWTAHWFADKAKWAGDLSKRCISQLRELLAESDYLETDPQFRLAFREFGTCLGIGCAFAPDDRTDDAVILMARSQEIISQWERYKSSSLTPEDLRPITRVMFATAFIPGAFKSGYFGREPIESMQEG